MTAHPAPPPLSPAPLGDLSQGDVGVVAPPVTTDAVPSSARTRLLRDRFGPPLLADALLSGLPRADEVPSPAGPVETGAERALALMATRTVEKVGDLDATDHCTEALREVVAAEPRRRRPVPVENEERPAAPTVDLMPTMCGRKIAVPGA
ncbi:hypothetical protein ACH4MA_03980 [Streptomyces roseolus]|uniref:hypothetical protein n=1 Tax=Streptomyces roseolus TaxID=67358 RepID=UPI0037B1C3AB